MRGTVIKVNTKEFILITENKLVLDNYVTDTKSIAVTHFIRKFPDMLITDNRWDYYVINNKIYKIAATKEVFL
ncbi:MAG: hypothetical protein HFI05_02005 [Lachnospiraceae bacterium]|jgi:hypothetical protein|nr:hypothetical protein [Lachnospiraceae bacterium]